MGWSLHRSIKVLPGIRLNIGMRGISTSIGGRGAHVTTGHGQVRETIGIPGSGLSYTHVDGAHHQTPVKAAGAEHAAAHADVPQEARPPLSTGAVARLIVFFGMLVILARIVWLLSLRP